MVAGLGVPILRVFTVLCFFGMDDVMIPYYRNVLKYWDT